MLQSREKLAFSLI
nr:unnamed protein product [Callosobruchus chinensis]